MSNILVCILTIFLSFGFVDMNLSNFNLEKINFLCAKNFFNIIKIQNNKFYCKFKKESVKDIFVYYNIYPKIDLKIEYIKNQIEYDFIIKPSGNIEDIKISFDDGSVSTINSKGDLLIRTQHINYIHKKPYCYQMIKGQVNPVKGEFRPLDSRTYGFKVNNYQHDRELIIDPIVMEFSTYLGGSFDDGGFAITVDNLNDIYIIGSTNSNNFPTFNAYQAELAGISLTKYDIFIAKLHKDGTLIFSTYMGGTDDDEPSGITIDSSKNVLITGYTASNDFPTITAYQNLLGGAVNAFVLKLDNTGSNLDFSTYLGGEGIDGGISINLDESRCIYVVGYTQSYFFPTKNAFQPFLNDWPTDGFITKFNNIGTNLEYSTYLGGTGWEYPLSSKTDFDGYVYLTGRTTSLDFPTKNAYQPNNGGGYPFEEMDGFVVKLDLYGKLLIYSTYLGGSGNEDIYDLNIDDSGSVFLCGNTCSPDFPTKNAYQPLKTIPDFLDSDGFLTRISPLGTSIIFSTFLGGSDIDACTSLISDKFGNTYVSGYTWSSDFPTLNALYGIMSGGLEPDCFLTKFDTSGKRLLFSTYIGGSAYDKLNDSTINSDGQIIFIGETESYDFPTKNAYQKIHGGRMDGFLVAFHEMISIPVVDIHDLIFFCLLFSLVISYFILHKYR